MKFSTENLARVFADEDKYTSFRKLASNLLHGNDIYEIDDNGSERHVSNTDANRAIRKVFMQVCGLTEEDLKSRKKRERAERAHATEIFEIIEEDIDTGITEGFLQNEWFNTIVDNRNAALGDTYEFIPNSNSLFAVCKTADNNHDVIMQELPAGTPVAINPTTHRIKIGKDIDLIIMGRIDYAKWIQKVAESFIADTQMEVYTAITGAFAQLPAALVKTGPLGDTTKETFDTLIDNVAAVNGSDVVIMGTKTALKKINKLADVNFISTLQKDAYAQTGIIGMYEGTALMEIPQRLRVGSVADGTFEHLIKDDVLYLLPVTEDKFVKFVDEGETEIYQVTDKGDLVDDFNTYEVVRRYAAGVLLGTYFGQWTITA